MHFLAVDWPSRPFATWEELEDFADEIDGSMVLGGLEHNAGATGVFSEWMIRTCERLGIGDTLFQRNDVCPDQTEDAFPSAGGLTAPEVSSAYARAADLDESDEYDAAWLPDLVAALRNATERRSAVVTLYC